MHAVLRRWLPALLWAGVVLGFSGAAFSAEATFRLIGPLVHLLWPSAPDETVAIVHSFVRKGAHLTEYAILALLVRRAVRSQGHMGAARGVALPLAFALVVAVLDEIHQARLVVRTGSLWDVALDGVGAALALLLAERVSRGRPSRGLASRAVE